MSSFKALGTDVLDEVASITLCRLRGLLIIANPWGEYHPSLLSLTVSILTVSILTDSDGFTTREAPMCTCSLGLAHDFER